MPTAQDIMSDSRFSYFLLQAHVATEVEGESTVTLTVEDLTSGEKRVFGTIHEFSRFLSRVVEPTGAARWAPPPSA